MTALAVGAAIGFVLMLALALTSLRRTRGGAARAGVERLAPGAGEWRALPGLAGSVSHLWTGRDGRLLASTTSSPRGSAWDEAAGRWDTTDELPPPSRVPPTTADTTWRALPGPEPGAWLTVRGGALALMPGETPLPPMPRCDPAKLHYRLATATRLDDGSLLACVWHEDDRTSRAWRLVPGASAWVDTGPLPVAATSSRLVAAGGRALLVGIAGEVALFDGAAWRPLPPLPRGHLGWQAALAPDGAVLAGGAARDMASRARGTRRAVIAASIVALTAAWLALALSPLGLVLGASLGVGAAVVLAFALVIVIGARF